jgi:hypothetical protein
MKQLTILFAYAYLAFCITGYLTAALILQQANPILWDTRTLHAIIFLFTAIPVLSMPLVVMVKLFNDL